MKKSRKIFATVLPNLAYAYHDYGVSYCFVVTGMRNGIRQPIDYSEVKVEQIKEGIDKKFKSEKKKSEVKKPNIIFLQLESFFDITKVKNYYFCTPRGAVPHACAQPRK